MNEAEDIIWEHDEDLNVSLIFSRLLSLLIYIYILFQFNNIYYIDKYIDKYIQQTKRDPWLMMRSMHAAHIRMWERRDKTSSVDFTVQGSQVQSS